MGDFEQSSAFLLHDTARLIRRRFDQALEDHGLTQARWRGLSILRRGPGVRQSGLAERLDIEKAPLGFSLDWLEQAGWIRREADPADRRARRAWLQESTMPTLGLVDEQLRQLEKTFLRGFDEDEVDDLLGGLQALRTRLREAGSANAAPPPATQPDAWFDVLSECSRLLGRRFDTRLAGIGFTRSQWLALNTVERREGLRQTELAEAIGLGAATTGKLVDALQTAGWLERRADAVDRRAKRLHLSRRARHILGATRERFDSMHEELERMLGTTGRHPLLDRLGWIRHRLLEELTHTAEQRRKRDPAPSRRQDDQASSMGRSSRTAPAARRFQASRTATGVDGEASEPST